MSAKPRAGVTWNFGHYIPANGFHPLYRALFANDAPVDFVSLNDSTFVAKVKQVPRFYQSALNDLQKIQSRWAAPLPAVRKQQKDFFGEENFTWQEALPCDIEIHHTMPLASLRKPFVIHCESHLSFFFPALQHGIGIPEVSFEDLRKLFLPIVESPLCLGIFSHIPETLEQLAQFFNSPVVSAKLYASKIGLDRSALNSLSGEDWRSHDTFLPRPICLFTASAHQNPQSFRLRGGSIALAFLSEWLSSGHTGTLLLRCPRPSDEDLRSMNVDPRWVRQEEGRRIFWITGYLSDAEQLSLFSKADFYLLPSANLHSVSILQAMAAGCVTIVTDTVGPNRYITHLVDGLILRGMKEELWCREDDTGLLFDRHTRIGMVEKKLADQLYRLVDEFWRKPDVVRSMRMTARQKIRESFDGSDFAADFLGTVAELLTAKSSIASKASEDFNRAYRRFWTGDRAEMIEINNCNRFFAGPPQPVPVYSTGPHQGFRLRNLHVWSSVDVLNEAKSLTFWSPLSASTVRRLTNRQIEIVDNPGHAYPFIFDRQQSNSAREITAPFSLAKAKRAIWDLMKRVWNSRVRLR